MSWLSHLSEWGVELHHVDLLLHAPQGACHSQHAATLVPLDTGHVHQCVYEHWAWRWSGERLYKEGELAVERGPSLSLSQYYPKLTQM